MDRHITIYTCNNHKIKIKNREKIKSPSSKAKHLVYSTCIQNSATVASVVQGIMIAGGVDIEKWVTPSDIT